MYGGRTGQHLLRKGGGGRGGRGVAGGEEGWLNPNPNPSSPSLLLIPTFDGQRKHSAIDLRPKHWTNC